MVNPSTTGEAETPPDPSREPEGRRAFARVAAVLSGAAVFVTGAGLAIADHASATTSSTTATGASSSSGSSGSSGVAVTSAQSGSAVAQTGGS